MKDHMVKPITYAVLKTARLVVLIGAALLILDIAKPGAAQQGRKLALVGGMLLDGQDEVEIRGGGPPHEHTLVR